MSAADPLILVGASLLLVGVLASRLSSRLGLPLLLLFIGIGMLAGEDGPGGMRFDDFELAFLVGQVALAVILLDGGLRTDLEQCRPVFAPAGVLATFGVVVTAGATAAFARWLLAVDWPTALLLGAIVSSTDAAAVFGLLGRGAVKLNQRIAATLEIESGANDPMAVFLVVLLVEIAGRVTMPSAAGLAGTLALQLGLGAAGGLLGGRVLVALLARLKLVEGLYALLVVSAGLSLFSLVNLVGGSGFLAVYVAGVIVGNRRSDATEHVFRVMDGLAWLAQATMFLVLGLLATPSLMDEHLPEALAVAAFLILVARPLAVALSLAPFRYPLREIGFGAWVGLRGAVPIVLAMFPLLAGLESGRLIFDLVFAVVLISLLVQGTTIAPLARVLRVEGPPADRAEDRTALDLPVAEPHELVQFRVPAGSPVLGEGADAPGCRNRLGDARCVGVLRGGRLLSTEAAGALDADDRLLVLQPSALGEQIAESLMATSGFAAGGIGTFALDGGAGASDLADAYAVTLTDAERRGTVAELVRRRLGHPVVAGDVLRLDTVELVVRRARRGRPERLGLRVPGGA